MLLLVLVSIAIAGFVISNIKNGIASEAEAAGTGGNILYVGGSGANNYTKIQDAINDANEGDTIFVYSGTYYENMVVNKSINLIGEDKETTIIDGSGNGDVVYISADWVNISGFTIRNSGWPYDGVRIYSSNNSIYNCNISNNSWYGIYGYYSSNNSICNCNITSNNDDGILLYSSYNNSIHNCNITSNNDDGISLSYSYSNSICNCNITSNNGDGIHAYSSSNNSIYNCNISDNIELVSSYNNSIYNCNISNNDYGIWLSYSSNNSIYNCNFINDGIFIEGGELSHYIHNIYNNNVNGKPLLYYKNAQNIILDGNAGEIILANCSNFEIKNMNISNTDIGIEIAFCNEIKIYNCNITSNNEDGIELWSSSNNSIYNCNISNNDDGIDAKYSSNNSIYNCNISNNNNGIWLLYYSSNNKIFGNKISNDSISLLYSSNKNCIMGNNISSNWYGIRLYSSDNNNISGNNVSSNSDDGISLDDSNNNNILNNNINSNNHVGMSLDDSNSNNLSGNSFFNCGLLVDDPYQNTVTNNTVNGKPLVYLEEESDIVVDDAGQVILINCDNITVQDQKLSNTAVGIELWDTDNCLIMGNNISNNHYGMHLHSSSNNTISGNNINSNNGDGICFGHSSNNNVISGNNILSNKDVGVYLGSSSNNTITGNNILSNKDVGVYLGSSSNNNISGNNISSNNWGGIWHRSSSNNNISGNNISNNYFGIYLTFSSNNDVSDNSFFNDGLIVDCSYHNTVENNTVNGKPLIYLENTSDYTIIDAGEVILVNCNNITVENLNLSNATVSVELWGTNNSKIMNNECSNNLVGIYIVFSGNNTIRNNKASNNEGGIDLALSNNNTITNNNVSNNYYEGIWLSYSSNNTVANNNASNNEYGIWLSDSSNNILTSNTAKSNNYGIYIDDLSNSNIIYHNNFIDNTQNAYDECSNIWDNGYPSGGNYWSDHNCTGNPSNGSQPYNISGGSNQDRYPFQDPDGWLQPALPVHNIDTGLSYSTIQEAIDAIETLDGHTIIVNPRIYNENLDVYKSLTIRSTSGSPEDTIVKASNPNDHVFEVTADYVNISGFTVEGTGFQGAGIYLYNIDHCNITNNNVTGNYGYGIFSNSSNNNTFVDNTVKFNYYYGIRLYWSNDNTLINNTIMITHMYSLVLDCSNNNTLMNNIVLGGHNGIWVWRSSGNILMNNILSYSKYCLPLSGSSNNKLINNTASNGGYGITLGGSSNNTLVNNNASNNWYGILLGESNDNKLTNNTISNNSYYGIYSESSNNNLIYNNYFNNTKNAHDDGKNIWNISKTVGTNIIGGPYLGGNYWSDYAGEDLDEDGFGDTLLPYNSSGNITNGGDWLPLVKVEEEPYTKKDVGVTTNITLASPEDIAAYLPPEYAGMDMSDAVVLTVNVTDNTPENPADDAYTDITIKVGELDIETCKVFKTEIGFLPEVDDVTTLPTVDGDPAFSRDLVNETVTVRLYVGDPLLGVIPPAAKAIFDTGKGTYPSIMGTHKGEIKPSCNITVSKLYTYPCPGTGGHTESIELEENGKLIANGTWNGYQDDYHNITINNVSGAPYVMLYEGHKYNYTIVTGSYPQIIHEPSKEVTGGTITCTLFTDANGKTYTDWIPAIKLE